MGQEVFISEYRTGWIQLYELLNYKQSYQVTLDISGSPTDFQQGSRKYPG